MPTRFRLIAAALLAAPIALLGLGSVTAQTANTEAAASIDPMCDYCADYTDAATEETPKQAEAERIRQEEETALRTRVLKSTATE